MRMRMMKMAQRRSQRMRRLHKWCVVKWKCHRKKERKKEETKKKKKRKTYGETNKERKIFLDLKEYIC